MSIARVPRREPDPVDVQRFMMPSRDCETCDPLRLCVITEPCWRLLEVEIDEAAITPMDVHVRDAGDRALFGLRADDALA
jgi:hypothetical protein